MHIRVKHPSNNDTNFIVSNKMKLRNAKQQVERVEAMACTVKGNFAISAGTERRDDIKVTYTKTK